MILLGLTGGIASGKSTVARLLEAKGAVVINADQLGHLVLEPTSDDFQTIVDLFGSEILTDVGTIDRAKLGEIVFGDEGRRKQLEAISHPQILRQISERLETLARSDDVVVLEAALLIEMMPDRGKALGLDALVVVSAFPQEQLERMVSDRGFSQRQAEERILAQGPLEKKLSVADYVIHNRGSLLELERAVDLFWEDITGGGVASTPWGSVQE